MPENKEMMEYKLPMYDITVKGKVDGMAELSAKFQIYCQQFGITNKESLAIWLAGSPRPSLTMSADEAMSIAETAGKKLPNVKVINVD